MSSVNEPKTNKQYWRSLEDYADTPEFQEFVAREFPGHEAVFTKGPSRRNFLKVMGASLAMAGLTGCRWPKEEILPFASRPETFLPGTSKAYATSFELGGNALGLLVSSYDGRPIKVEGNPDHPSSLGATDAIAQASVLGVYDPDRSQRLVHREKGQEVPTGWTEFFNFIRSHKNSLNGNGGARLRVLAEPSSSLSRGSMQEQLLQAYPGAKWHTWSPVLSDTEHKGSMAAFGRPVRSHYHFDQAHVIVALDADPLHEHPASVRYARDFIRSRNYDENGWMSRAFSIESTLSLFGTMADYRYALKPTQIRRATLGLALELQERGLLTGGNVSARGANLAELRETFPYITEIAEAIEAAHRAGHPSLIVAGADQPAEVHHLVHQLIAWLGNVGQTVTYSDDPLYAGGADSLRTLVQDIQNGQVDTLLILGGNPVYDAPADMDFASALKQVSNTIHLSLYQDETSALCSWHLPEAHYLESWNDARSWDGTVGIVQPLIEPLYDGKSSLEVLALFLGDELLKGYDIVRDALRPHATDQNFEEFWRRSLHDGMVPGTQLRAVTPRPNSNTPDLAAPNAAEDTFEVRFDADPKVYDGRYCNNGWLQELPAPLTKVAWDNAVLMSTRDADNLQVKHGDVVTLTVNNQQLDMPVYILPGVAPGAVTVTLGYGREQAGRVGNGVGFNVYPLRTAETLRVATGATVAKTGATHELATTQDHHAIDTMGQIGAKQRFDALVREASLGTYQHDSHHFEHMGPHHPPLKSLWEEWDYSEGYKWGMAVDLNSCIGCNACVVACQAENNIAVVGKDEVAYGREMHWLRIDRYFSGEPQDENDIQVSYQPVMCQHCESAPCEPVCPVAATVHDDDGLNVMVYNRCIGTRYCSNNCPFKVRRFNYFANEADLTQTEKMVQNPEVTVRGRGVMEKCTFCTQRISKAKIEAKNDGRRVRDHELTTACAQACPTQAIVFGDLNDTESKVRKLHENNRAYAMLTEMNIRPRVSYLGRLRNVEDGEAHGDGHGGDDGDNGHESSEGNAH